MTRSRSQKPNHDAYAKGCTVAYLRVSTTEQSESGAGLDAQRASIEAYALRAGIQIDAWHVDAGVSGSIAPLDRDELSAALRTLSGCSGGTLIVAKLDRLTRSSLDLHTLLELAKREGWKLASADGTVDMSSPFGRAMVGMSGVFAELERDLIRTRTREGMAAKRQQGVRLGRPTTLPEDIRQRIADERADGATFAAIAAGLNEDKIPTARGGLTWYPSTVKSVCVSLEHDAFAAARVGS
jgi:DNA invertase Pin-like site-specific DNA recombinase